MPSLTEQKQLKRDRASIRASIKELKNPAASDADRRKASAAIATTVLKTTGFAADENTPKMLADLTAALVDTGTVGLLGIEESIKLKVSPEDAASIPQKVVKRLSKLV